MDRGPSSRQRKALLGTKSNLMKMGEYPHRATTHFGQAMRKRGHKQNNEHN